ncbi:MAG: Thiamine pyrophosphate enzyme central domain family [Nitrospira sp.]|nr:Thiamine pyrophosphate enzyme central domain family [Nitrospira sp.]
MKASELLVRCLEHEGVRYIFGVPGEENLDVMDALLDSSVRFVVARHEQGAAFMADVQGRLTGKAGVCLSTLGPGATNLLTGVADAYLDRAPLVALTAQVSLDRMHKESHQFVDVRSMFRPVTKWNADISTPHIIPEAVRKAFKVAETEKPGATHLELPEDVAAQQLTDTGMLEPLLVQHPVLPEPVASQVARAVNLIEKSRRPIVLAGNGIVRGSAQEALRLFARRLNIPVVHTFMAKGVLPDSDPLSLYTIGLQMQDYAARVMAESDLVIATGYDPVEYAPCFWNPDRNKTIVHVDVAPAEVDAHYVVGVGVVGNIALSIEAIEKSLQPCRSEWAGHCRRTIQNGFDEEYAVSRSWPMRPQHIVRDLRAALEPNDLVICDVGAHKLWMARMFPCERPNACIISNGFASMGIGLPGAVAAQLLHPDRHVVTVTGDAGFLMNSQELETAVRLALPIVILIWRDDGYGVIRWNQQVRFKRTSGVEFGNPDFIAYAESFGAAGFRVEGPLELTEVLTKALACGRPAVVDCPVDYAENIRLSDRLHRLS